MWNGEKKSSPSLEKKRGGSSYLNAGRKRKKKGSRHAPLTKKGGGRAAPVKAAQEGEISGLPYYLCEYQRGREEERR